MNDLVFEPLTKARKLIEVWHEHWGSCERLSDMPFELAPFLPQIDDIAIFDTVDHGFDFLLREIGGNLAALVCCDRRGTSLSEFSSPYRQMLRRMLLAVVMIREPATEHYAWIEGDRIHSCTLCALPVRGDYYQSSQFLLGVFQRVLGDVKLTKGAASMPPSRETVTLATTASHLPRNVSKFPRQKRPIW